MVASTFLRRVCLLDVRDDKMECTNEHTEHRNAVIGVVSRVSEWKKERRGMRNDHSGKLRVFMWRRSISRPF